MALGVIEIEVKPDLSGFEREIRSAVKSAQGSNIGDSFGRSIGSNMTTGIIGSLGGLATSALSGLVNIGMSIGRTILDGVETIFKYGAGAAAAALGTAIGTGVSTYMQLESAQAAFTKMLPGGADAAAEMMAQLKEFAVRTPFNFTDIADATKYMVNLGLDSKRVLPIMEVVGDAVSAFGGGNVEIQRVGKALVQVAQSGKVYSQDMFQLAQSGVPAWDALAAHLGLTAEETRKQVADVGVPAEELFKALEERAGPALQRSFGAMATQAQTTQGLISNLKDRIQFGLAEAVAPAMEKIKPMLGPDGAVMQLFSTIEKIVTPISNLLVKILIIGMPIIAKLADAAAKFLAPVADALVRLLDKLAPSLGPLGDALAGALEKAGPMLADILDKIGPILDKFAEWATGSLKDLPGRFQDVTDKLQPLIDAFGWFKDLFDQGSPILSDWATHLLPVLVDVFKLVADVLAKVLPTLLKVIGAIERNVTAPLLDVIKELIPKFQAVFDAAWPFVQQVLEYLADTLLPKLTPIIQDAGKALGPMIDNFKDLAEKHGPFVRDLMERLIDIFGKIVDAVGPMIPKVIEIAGAFQKLADPLLTLASWLMPSVLNFIGLLADALGPLMSVIGWTYDKFANLVGGIQTLIDWLVNLYNTILGPVVSALDRIRTIGGDIIDSITGGIKDAASKVWETMRNYVLNPLKDNLSDSWNNVKSIGQTIIDKVKEGVSGKAKDIADAVSGLLGGIKDLITIPDFSQIGRDMMDGVKSGIEEKAFSVANAMSGGLLGVLRAAQQTIASHSPSKLFAREIGQPIMQGVALGITQETPATQATLDAMLLSLAGYTPTGMATGTAALYGSQAATQPVPQVSVYIGDTELTDIVRTEVRASDDRLAVSMAGRLY